MYVRLKHTLSTLALEAIRQPGRSLRRGVVPWLLAFCDLAERSARHGAYQVPIAAVAARAQQVRGAAARGLDDLLRTGLVERRDGTLSLPEAFRPHLPYLRRQVSRLAAALQALACAPKARGDRAIMQKGAALFNAGLFFECHEFLEDVWRSAPAEERPFYHGVILVAAAFYHQEKGNLHGTRVKLGEGLKLLERYLPASHGVRLDRWLAVLAPWKDRIQAGRIIGVLSASEIPRIPLEAGRRRRR
ncbi:MAG: DUF309 domain-containing protein [Armatimonadetes bacterium]|nr:DUF309 domain-containing protein [Armatimonadota bacterium]